jgi:hypothetical protein
MPLLKRNDSDLVVGFILQHGTAYAKPVDDPLFPAHKVSTLHSPENSTQMFYLPDSPALGIFGCQIQVG